MLSKVIGIEIKDLIRERKHTKEEIIDKIYRKHGRVERPFALSLWYDCCYASVCEELGINLKTGEAIKLKRKVRLKSKHK